MTCASKMGIQDVHPPPPPVGSQTSGHQLAQLKLQQQQQQHNRPSSKWDFSLAQTTPSSPLYCTQRSICQVVTSQDVCLEKQQFHFFYRWTRFFCFQSRRRRYQISSFFFCLLLSRISRNCLFLNHGKFVAFFTSCKRRGRRRWRWRNARLRSVLYYYRDGGRVDLSAWPLERTGAGDSGVHPRDREKTTHFLPTPIEEREREKERANHTLSPVLSFSSLARVSVGLCCFCCRICSNFIEKHAQVGEASKHGVYTVNTHTHYLFSRPTWLPESSSRRRERTKRQYDETRWDERSEKEEKEEELVETWLSPSLRRLVLLGCRKFWPLGTTQSAVTSLRIKHHATTSRRRRGARQGGFCGRKRSRNSPSLFSSPLSLSLSLSPTRAWSSS